MADITKQAIAMTMVAMMGVILLPLIAEASPYVPPPPAATYCCAIHDRLGTPTCYATLAELEAHFATEHPSTPIDIIWG